VRVAGDDIGRVHLDLAKFEDLVEERFQKQYRNPLLPRFQQLDRDKTVLVIDDFDHAHLNAIGRLKLLSIIHSRYERVFIFGDDVLKLEEIATGQLMYDVLLVTITSRFTVRPPVAQQTYRAVVQPRQRIRS